MGRSGPPAENAVAESFVATLQTELLDRHRWPTRNGIRTAIFEFIEVFYNRQRRHSHLGYLSPVEFERRWYEELAKGYVGVVACTVEPWSRGAVEPWSPWAGRPLAMAEAAPRPVEWRRLRDERVGRRRSAWPLTYAVVVTVTPKALYVGHARASRVRSGWPWCRAAAPTSAS